jgi:uncharacterized protein
MPTDPRGARAPDPAEAGIVLRLHGDLAGLCRVGGPQLRVASGGSRSVKDAIESVGVPHTEVAHLAVDGDPADFGHRLEGGEEVDAFPPVGQHRRSGSVLPVDPPRRFVCDVHLGTLARRLRLLGFDTSYANDADDRTLVRIAVEDHRVLLSRDRGLLSRRAVEHGYLPRSDDPDDQLAEVVARFGLAADAAPLIRCVRCNTLLVAVTLAEVADAVPPRSRRAFDRFARCPACGQVYWPGSHIDALASTLALVGHVTRAPSDDPAASDPAASDPASSPSSAGRPGTELPPADRS